MDFIFITKKLNDILRDVYGDYIDKIIDDFKSIGGLFAVFGGLTISTKVLNRIPYTEICDNVLITRKITTSNIKRHHMSDIVAIMDISEYRKNHKLYPSIVKDFFANSLIWGTKLRHKINTKNVNTHDDGTLIIIDGKFCYDAHAFYQYY